MAEDITELFATELGVFRDRLDKWLVHDLGRHALIKEQEVLGLYDTQNDAIAVGYQTYGNVAFLVKEVLPYERPATFTRDILQQVA